MATWAERDAAVVWHGFTQMASFLAGEPVIVEAAEGHELIDVSGRRYLDAISSLWVSTLGHRVPELDQAVRDQLDRVAHSTMLGHGNRVVVELAEALAGAVPVDGPHVLFASDGAAAVEQALKIAFQYWANQGVAGRTSYLALGGAYHGDTVGSLSVGDTGFGAGVFDPLRFPVVRAPGYDQPGALGVAAGLVARHRDRLAAVVIEPLVQGAAGMHTAPAGEFEALAEVCRNAGVLLIADEVATGFGRTGTLFASEQCGLRPDLMCLGKGLTAGYVAMSATVASDRVFEAFLGEDLGPRTLYHGHSYGGNALAAAVAVRHLRLLDEWDVLANVRARSAQLAGLLHDRVEPRPAVAEVRICGLMAGVELAPPGPGQRWGRRVCAAAVRRGVLLRPLGDVVVLMPPLTITAGEVERIVDVLAEALDEVAGDGPVAGPVAAAAAGDGPGGWVQWAGAEVAATKAAGRWRTVRDLDRRAEGWVVVDANGTLRPVVSFASNDYLGLSTHPAVISAAGEALQRWGAGAGAARLVAGSRPVHSELEAELADWKQTARAALFTTGYTANLGVLTALADRGTHVVSDERNHASIIDGCRLSRARVSVVPHGDVAAVDAALRAGSGRALVVSDTVFSMDGDVAPVDELASVCARHGALLVLDEAHAVLGPEPPLDACLVMRVGTLSKAAGALGGFVAGPDPLVEIVVNRARPFIFTTATPPADAAAALAAVRVLRSGEGDERRARLRARVERLAPGHPTPIVAVLVGSEDDAVAASRALLDAGLLVPAIRPPTVAPGTSRLRIAVSASHSDHDVDRLAAALATLPRAP